MKKTMSGFTIVELLIVIVVIAILAAIAIISYNGVINRAEVTKTANAVEAYRKALLIYKADNKIYPTTGAFCLGDQYPLLADTGVAACRYKSSPIANTAGAANRNLLKPYIGENLPMPSTKSISYGTNEFVGAHFYGSAYNYTLDGKPVVTIEYYVKSKTCPVGPVYTASPPTFSSPEVDRSQSLGDASRCYLLLEQ